MNKAFTNIKEIKEGYLSVYAETFSKECEVTFLFSEQNPRELNFDVDFDNIFSDKNTLNQSYIKIIKNMLIDTIDFYLKKNFEVKLVAEDQRRSRATFFILRKAYAIKHESYINTIKGDLK